MKTEYKEKALDNLNSIKKRTTVIHEMLSGQRPANQEEAIRMVKDIERLVELSENIIDIS